MIERSYGKLEGLTHKHIIEKYGIKMSELATQWAIKSGVTCALVGARNVKQLEENVKALDAPVTPEIIQELNEVTENLKEKLGNHFVLTYFSY